MVGGFYGRGWRIGLRAAEFGKAGDVFDGEVPGPAAVQGRVVEVYDGTF